MAIHQSARGSTCRFASWTCAIVLALYATSTPAQNAAQSYPSKPIHIIVPVVPGGGGASDPLARMIGPHLTAAWGQQVIVENRPGAGGQLGTEAVARAAPDGYTLLIWDYGSLTIASLLRPTFRVDPVRDLLPVTVLTYSPYLLVVHPSVPASSVKELIALAKAQPGKLNYAVTGIGSSPHLTGILFAMETGIKWAYIPAKGGAQAMIDVISGQADVLFNSMLALLPFVKSKQLKLLAVSSPERIASIPETPTVIESGIAGFIAGASQGILAPAGVPKEVIGKLNAQIAAVLAQPDIRQKLIPQGAQVVANSPEKASAYLRDMRSRWSKVAKESDIKLD
jgi:tripartite-type tricarboxylate transporter receptor subunit TctC